MFNVKYGSNKGHHIKETLWLILLVVGHQYVKTAYRKSRPVVVHVPNFTFYPFLKV